MCQVLSHFPLRVSYIVFREHCIQRKISFDSFQRTIFELNSKWCMVFLSKPYNAQLYNHVIRWGFFPTRDSKRKPFPIVFGHPFHTSSMYAKLDIISEALISTPIPCSFSL